MKNLALALTLLCTATPGLAACGGGDSPGTSTGDEDQIRDVIALGNNRDTAVCDRLTDRWMKDVVGGDRADCEQQVRQSPEDAVEIEEVSVDGDRATVTARIEGDAGRLLLAKQGGEWQLDDVQQGP